MLRLAVGLVLLLPLWPARSRAWEPPPYDVYVSREGEVVEKIAPERTVDAETIRERSARTLDELLEFEPGIYVRKGNEGVPRIDMRGLRSRHVLLLLDGIPFNWTEDGQFDPTLLATEGIEATRIGFGNTSVLYGDGPIGGVLQVQTLRPSEGLRGSVGFDHRGGDQNLARFNVSGAGERFDLLVAGSTYHQTGFLLSDDFDASGSENGGLRENARKDRRNLLVRTGFTPSETLRLGALVSALHGSFGVPPNAIDDPGDPFASRVRFERVKDQDGLSGQLSAQWDPESPLEVRAWGFFNGLEEERTRYDDATYQSISNERVSGTFDANNESAIRGGALHAAYDLGAIHRVKLALGARHESFSTHGVIRDERLGGGRFGLRAFDESSHQVIYNSGLEWELHPLDGFGTVLGYGRSWIAKDEGDRDEDPGFLAGAWWDVRPGTRLRGSAARKLRFPSLRQLHEPGTGNPDLRAEHAWEYEAGVAQALPGGARLDAALFWLEVEDFIEVDPVTLRSENNDRYRFRGFELTVDAQPLDGVDLRLAYSLLDSENRSRGTSEDELPNRPMHRAALETRWRLPFGFALRAAFQYVADQYVYSRQAPVRQRETGDYFLADLRLTRPLLEDRLTLYVGADNLADTDYQRSYGVPDAGRVFYGGFEARF